AAQSRGDARAALLVTIAFRPPPSLAVGPFGPGLRPPRSGVLLPLASPTALMRYDATHRFASPIAMKQTFLDFEQPIAELQAKIDELRYVHEDSAVDISDEIERLQKKSQQLTKEIYSKLTAWQVAQVARHPQRPYTLDYISGLFADFRELHGDRSCGDDPAIVG